MKTYYVIKNNIGKCFWDMKDVETGKNPLRFTNTDFRITKFNTYEEAEVCLQNIREFVKQKHYAIKAYKTVKSLYIDRIDDKSL
jgi:hypothetical protein